MLKARINTAGVSQFGQRNAESPTRITCRDYLNAKSSLRTTKHTLRAGATNDFASASACGSARAVQHTCVTSQRGRDEAGGRAGKGGTGKNRGEDKRYYPSPAMLDILSNGLVTLIRSDFGRINVF